MVHKTSPEPHGPDDIYEAPFLSLTIEDCRKAAILRFKVGTKIIDHANVSVERLRDLRDTLSEAIATIEKIELEK